MNTYFVYILALEDGNYYVGITHDVYKRYCDHKSGKGAHFTRIHRPIGLVCAKELSTWRKNEAEQIETKITQVMMTLFGIEHVRGGDYYQADVYTMKMCMGTQLCSEIERKRAMVDRESIFEKYPEISHGLLMQSMIIDFPMNISSYHVWPTNAFFEKAVSKMNNSILK